MINKKYHHFSFIILGLLTGICGCALGIGGGVIVVPALTLLFAFDFKKSVACSLATIIPAAMVGAISYMLLDIKTGSDNIQLTTALITAAGAIVGSFIGVKTAHITHEKLLKTVFAVLLIITSLKLLNIIKISTSQVESSPWFFLILLGLFAGFASGMLGIGGGVIIVPILTLFFVDSIHQAIPTSLVIIIPTTIAGTIFHNKACSMDFKPLKFLIPAAMTGAVLGVILKSNLKPETLKIFFSIFIIISAIKMLLSHSKK